MKLQRTWGTKESRVQSLERNTEPDYPCQCSCASAKADPLLTSCWEGPTKPLLPALPQVNWRNEKADFCLELADTYHFASKRMKFWMLFLSDLPNSSFSWHANQPPVGKQQKQPQNHQKQTPPQLNSASAKKTQVVPSMKSSYWHLRCAPEIPPTCYS